MNNLTRGSKNVADNLSKERKKSKHIKINKPSHNGKNSKEKDEQFRRTFRNKLLDRQTMNDYLKLINKPKYLKDMREKKQRPLNTEDEIWEPHTNVARPRRMSFSVFNNLNLIQWGAVYTHVTGLV